MKRREENRAEPCAEVGGASCHSYLQHKSDTDE